MRPSPVPVRHMEPIVVVIVVVVSVVVVVTAAHLGALSLADTSIVDTLPHCGRVSRGVVAAVPHKVRVQDDDP